MKEIEGGHSILPKYKCKKIVKAGKILEVRDNKIAVKVENLTEEKFTWITPSEDYFERQKHIKDLVGGIYVIYEEGYDSWSPDKIFERGYDLFNLDTSS